MSDCYKCKKMTFCSTDNGLVNEYECRFKNIKSKTGKEIIDTLSCDGFELETDRIYKNVEDQLREKLKDAIKIIGELSGIIGMASTYTGLMKGDAKLAKDAYEGFKEATKPLLATKTRKKKA